MLLSHDAHANREPNAALVGAAPVAVAVAVASAGAAANGVSGGVYGSASSPESVWTGKSVTSLPSANEKMRM